MGTLNLTAARFYREIAEHSTAKATVPRADSSSFYIVVSNCCWGQPANLHGARAGLWRSGGEEKHAAQPELVLCKTAS